jgi:hypothetical protein
MLVSGIHIFFYVLCEEIVSTFEQLVIHSQGHRRLIESTDQHEECRRLGCDAM